MSFHFPSVYNQFSWSYFPGAFVFWGFSNISFFSRTHTCRSSTISSLPFKAIITSFQNASALEHSQGTSWTVHFLTCHTSFCPCGNGFQALNQISDRKQVTFILPSFFYSLFAYLLKPNLPLLIYFIAALLSYIFFIMYLLCVS